MADPTTARVTVQAALVLYKMPLANSPAFAAWKTHTATHPDFAADVDLMVFDNTPGAPNPAPPDYGGQYIAQPHNPGLAASYQHALETAERNGATWLLLLDHDTVLTPEYLSELQARKDEFAGMTGIVAIVPKLLEHGNVQSPNPGFTARRQPPFPRDAQGIIDDQRCHIFNSGALIRVASLQAIGGFPQDFWLDSLDHAVFHLLRQNGGRVYLMQAALEHTLSSNAAPNPNDPAYIARQKNMLNAEALFHRRYATPEERAAYRNRLVRNALNAAIRNRDFGTAWRTAKAAWDLKMHARS